MTKEKAFYAPTFIDESMTCPDKHGRSRPTGNLRGLVVGRKFTCTRTGKIKAERLLIPFSWGAASDDVKAEALAKAIAGMEELADLDQNPPLNWIPDFVRNELKQENTNAQAD